MNNYTVAIRTIQVMSVNANNAEDAIEAARASLHPSVAATAAFQIVQDTTYDEETQSFHSI